jgi:hypothetical protein
MAEATKQFTDLYNPVFSDFARRSMLQSSAMIQTTHDLCDREVHARAKYCWGLIRGIIEGEGFIPAHDNRAQIRALIEEALTAESRDLDERNERAARGLGGKWPDLSEPRRNAIEAAMAEVDVDLLARRRRRAAIEDELGAPRYQPARDHWRKALSLAEQDRPDLENAVKEAVSAVESLGQVILGKPGVTLGDAIKQLRSQQRIPRGADAVLEGLWTFANTAPGVRHGSARAADTTDSDWAFARTTSEAALRLLLDADAAR